MYVFCANRTQTNLSRSDQAGHEPFACLPFGASAHFHEEASNDWHADLSTGYPLRKIRPPRGDPWLPNREPGGGMGGRSPSRDGPAATSRRRRQLYLLVFGAGCQDPLYP